MRTFGIIATGASIGIVMALVALLVVLPLFRPSSPAPQPLQASAGPSYGTPPTRQPAGPASPASRIPTGSAIPAADLARLQELVEAEAGRIPGRVSVHVRLDGGGEAGIGADEPMPAASVIKLPLMVVLMDAWRTGQLKRTPADEARVRAAITRSDNEAADGLIDRVGRSQVNAWLEEHGYAGTQLRHKMLGPRPDGPNVVTAAEMTRMLLRIARGELVSPEASREMRALLLAQERRTRIPAGLPPEAVVGNKTGTLRGIVNDVGFVEVPGGRRYALAVLVSEAGSDAATSRAIARLSSKTYEFLAENSARP